MEIKLETRHFRDAERYQNSKTCPLNNAVQEANPDAFVGVSISSLFIDDKRYTIEGGEVIYSEDGPDTIKAYSGLSESDVDTLIAKAKAGEEIETVIVNLIPVE